MVREREWQRERREWEREREGLESCAGRLSNTHTHTHQLKATRNKKKTFLPSSMSMYTHNKSQ